jgi:hypothetical protein
MCLASASIRQCRLFPQKSDHFLNRLKMIGNVGFHCCESFQDTRRGHQSVLGFQAEQKAATHSSVTADCEWFGAPNLRQAWSMRSIEIQRSSLRAPGDDYDTWLYSRQKRLMCRSNKF